MATAGRVDFPEYMKDWHTDWLGSWASSYSTVSEAMGDALANNPFDGKTAYNPSSDLADMRAALTTFYNEACDITTVDDWNNFVSAAGYGTAEINSIDPVNDWNIIIGNSAFSDSDINDINPIDDWGSFLAASVANTNGVDTYDSNITDQLESQTLPQYRAGMRNIGAVMTSAFAIGESNLYAFKNRDVNQFASQVAQSGIQFMAQIYDRKKGLENDFRNHAVTVMHQLRDRKIMAQAEYRSSALQTMLQIQANKLNSFKAWLASAIEAYRMDIVATKEQEDSDLRIAEDGAKWPLEVYQYGANLLASVSGAPTQVSGTKSPSTGQSALAGAFSGAALGGAIANSTGISSGWGSLAGAAAGAAMSFL